MLLLKIDEDPCMDDAEHTPASWKWHCANMLAWLACKYPTDLHHGVAEATLRKLLGALHEDHNLQHVHKKTRIMGF